MAEAEGRVTKGRPRTTNDTLSAEPAAVNALRDAILNPATSPLALAVDVPFKAAMLGLEWPEVRRLFDERERRRRLAELAGRD